LNTEIAVAGRDTLSPDLLAARASPERDAHMMPDLERSRHGTPVLAEVS